MVYPQVDIFAWQGRSSRQAETAEAPIAQHVRLMTSETPILQVRSTLQCMACLSDLPRARCAVQIIAA